MLRYRNIHLHITAFSSKINISAKINLSLIFNLHRAFMTSRYSTLHSKACIQSSKLILKFFFYNPLCSKIVNVHCQPVYMSLPISVKQQQSPQLKPRMKLNRKLMKILPQRRKTYVVVVKTLKMLMK